MGSLNHGERALLVCVAIPQCTGGAKEQRREVWVRWTLRLVEWPHEDLNDVGVGPGQIEIGPFELGAGC